MQDHGYGCEVAQQQGVRRSGFISPYQKYWYNGDVRRSGFVDLAWYWPGFHPRGSLGFWNIRRIMVMMEFGDIPGEPRRTQQGNSSREKLIGHCTSEMQSLPPLHELCCCYFYFYFFNKCCVCVLG